MTVEQLIINLSFDKLKLMFVASDDCISNITINDLMINYLLFNAIAILPLKLDSGNEKSATIIIFDGDMKLVGMFPCLFVWGLVRRRQETKCTQSCKNNIKQRHALMHLVGVQPKILSLVSHSFCAYKHLTERARKYIVSWNPFQIGIEMIFV